MEYVFDSRWTDTLSASDKYVEDFIFILASTWGESSVAVRKKFENRYFHNIYGPSLLTIVYCDGKPAASGAMWRNDIGDRVAYQHIDTCTLGIYRGRGLFKRATEEGLSLIGEFPLVYGFANPSSLAGYIKFGWEVLKPGSVKIFFSKKKYTHYNNTSRIDTEYALWYLTEFKDRLRCVKRGGAWFLVLPTRYRKVYQIIGLADERAVVSFERISPFCLLIYSVIPSRADRFKRGNIVAIRFRNDSIPIWKADAL